MSRPPNLSDLKKRIGIRKYLWLLGLLVLLLIDEFVKEGYFFNPSDVLIYGTHEFLATLDIIALILFFVYDTTKKMK